MRPRSGPSAYVGLSRARPLLLFLGESVSGAAIGARVGRRVRRERRFRPLRRGRQVRNPASSWGSGAKSPRFLSPPSTLKGQTRRPWYPDEPEGRCSKGLGLDRETWKPGLVIGGRGRAWGGGLYGSAPPRVGLTSVTLGGHQLCRVTMFRPRACKQAPSSHALSATVRSRGIAAILACAPQSTCRR